MSMNWCYEIKGDNGNGKKPFFFFDSVLQKVPFFNGIFYKYYEIGNR